MAGAGARIEASVCSRLVQIRHDPPRRVRPVERLEERLEGLQRNVEGDDVGGGGKAAKKQTKVLSPLSLANKTKVSFKSATSSAATLQSVIEHNAEWQWASNEHTQRPLHEARAALDQAVASNRFAQIFLTMPDNIRQEQIRIKA